MIRQRNVRGDRWRQSVDVFMPWFVSDYLRATRRNLMAEEHGAYLMILGALWNMNGSLPAELDRLRLDREGAAVEWPQGLARDRRSSPSRTGASPRSASLPSSSAPGEHQAKASERGRQPAEKRWHSVRNAHRNAIRSAALVNHPGSARTARWGRRFGVSHFDNESWNRRSFR